MWVTPLGPPPVPLSARAPDYKVVGRPLAPEVCQRQHLIRHPHVQHCTCRFWTKDTRRVRAGVGRRFFLAGDFSSRSSCGARARHVPWASLRAPHGSSRPPYTCFRGEPSIPCAVRHTFAFGTTAHTAHPAEQQATAAAGPGPPSDRVGGDGPPLPARQTIVAGTAAHTAQPR
jgi:hypothetical protein